MTFARTSSAIAGVPWPATVCRLTVEIRHPRRWDTRPPPGVDRIVSYRDVTALGAGVAEPQHDDRAPGGAVSRGRRNTGVPAGTKLTVVNGDRVYTTNNQVISGVDIRGFVRIRARNVRNSIVRGGSPRRNSAVIFVERGWSTKIEDSEIIPTNPNPCLDGIWAENATLTLLSTRTMLSRNSGNVWDDTGRPLPPPQRHD